MPNYHATSEGNIPFTAAEETVWAVEQAAALAVAFPNAKAAFILSVKAEAGQLTTQVLSGLGSEYELAEKESTAFKAAGYPTEPIPDSVQAEINSKAAKNVTVTATVACNTILAAAVDLRSVQATLRNKRLTTASAAEVAADATELDAIKSEWITYINTLKKTLGI